MRGTAQDGQAWGSRMRATRTVLSDAVVSGLFVVIGTALGRGLSEAGAGWRSRVERRRVEQADWSTRGLSRGIGEVTTDG